MKRHLFWGAVVLALLLLAALGLLAAGADTHELDELEDAILRSEL